MPIRARVSSSYTIFYATFVLATFAFFAVYYRANGNHNLKCAFSSVDGEHYCVRARSDLNRAVNLLARATAHCKRLVMHMDSKYPNRPEVQRLARNFDPTVISETLPTSEHTAYTENKGDAMAFCLNKHDKPGSRLIDLNTLTFVAIHELGHVMTESLGHKQEFWTNFKFLLENAIDIGIYRPIDYKKNPQPFCGMTITDNPHYDM